MKVKIADIITELNPKYVDTIELIKPFLYDGKSVAEFQLTVADDYIEALFQRANGKSTRAQLENFAFSNAFNRKVIAYDAMLVHSSALVYNNGAYLFSGNSGVGKTTHTKLWLKAFGDKVHIMNDDKPVVRLYNDHAMAFGTPFDGGSGIALNESFPLKAIIFVERGEENSVRIPESKEIIQKLYFQTARMVNRETAEKMLLNFEKLLTLSKFYVLTCNMDISAAYVAFDGIINSDK